VLLVTNERTDKQTKLKKIQSLVIRLHLPNLIRAYYEENYEDFLNFPT